MQQQARYESMDLLKAVRIGDVVVVMLTLSEDLYNVLLMKGDHELRASFTKQNGVASNAKEFVSVIELISDRLANRRLQCYAIVTEGEEHELSLVLTDRPSEVIDWYKIDQQLDEASVIIYKVVCT